MVFVNRSVLVWGYLLFIKCQELRRKFKNPKKCCKTMPSMQSAIKCPSDLAPPIA